MALKKLGKTAGGNTKNGINIFNNNGKKTSLDDIFNTAISIDEMKDNLKKQDDAGNSRDYSAITNELMALKGKGYTAEQIANTLNIPKEDQSKFKKLVNALQDGGEQLNPSKNIHYKVDDVLGLPFRWNFFADPNRRVYNDIYTADATNIVSVIPGVPKFRREDDELKNIDVANLLDDDENDMSSKLKEFGAGLDSSNPLGIFSWLSKGIFNKDNKDLRYMVFEQNYKEWRKYFDKMFSVVGQKMGIEHSFKSLDDYVSMTWEDNMAFKFFCGNKASGDYNTTNSTSGSDVMSTINDTAGKIQEVKYLLQNSKSNQNVSSEAESGIAGVADKVTDVLSGILHKASGGAADEITNSARMALKGYNLYFPEMWKSSTFSKTISLSFQFVSPYGDPTSIFQYVYIPFLIWLSFALPRQTGSNAFTSPFLVQVDIPGYLTSNCAIVESMNWNIGGSNHYFSKDGLPLEITVSVNIKDLYPFLSMSKSWGGLRTNHGMHSFLDNISGLSLSRFSPTKDMMDSIKARGQYLLGTFDRVFDDVGGWIGRITHPS